MSGVAGKAPEKMGSSTENLIPGFQPAPSATQADAFGGSSFTAGSGEFVNTSYRAMPRTALRENGSSLS